MTAEEQKNTIGDLVIRFDQRKKEIVCLESKLRDAISQIKKAIDLFEESSTLERYPSHEEISQWKKQKEIAEEDKKDIEGRLRNYGLDIS